MNEGKHAWLINCKTGDFWLSRVIGYLGYPFFIDTNCMHRKTFFIKLILFLGMESKLKGEIMNAHQNVLGKLKLVGYTCCLITHKNGRIKRVLLCGHAPMESSLWSSNHNHCDAAVVHIIFVTAFHLVTMCASSSVFMYFYYSILRNVP